MSTSYSSFGMAVYVGLSKPAKTSPYAFWLSSALEILSDFLSTSRTAPQDAPKRLMSGRLDRSRAKLVAWEPISSAARAAVKGAKPFFRGASGLRPEAFLVLAAQRFAAVHFF